MRRVLSVLLLVGGCATAAMAAIRVPEIDPASGGSALALLASGLLILRGRRKK